MKRQPHMGDLIYSFSLVSQPFTVLQKKANMCLIGVCLHSQQYLTMRTFNVYKSMLLKMDANFKTSVKARKLSGSTVM